MSNEHALADELVTEAREQFRNEMDALVRCAEASPYHTDGSRGSVKVMRDAAVASFDAAIASLSQQPAPEVGPTDAFHLTCPNCEQAIDLIPAAIQQGERG